MLKVLAIVGNHPRHNAFVSAIDKVANITGVIRVCRESFIPEPPKNLTKQLKELWKLHFNTRAASENRFFSKHKEFKLSKTAAILHIAPEELNSIETVSWYREHDNEFDAICIQGIPIIKNPLLAVLTGYSINLHMGLIPDWKGTMSPFWCFYFLVPQMVGCTYHIIDKYVDTGEILHQVVPELSRGDGMHDVACKACLKAYDDVGLVLNNVEKRISEGIPPCHDSSLQRKGKLFCKSDWQPEMLRMNYEVFEDRVVDAYLDGKLNGSKVPKLVQVPQTL